MRRLFDRLPAPSPYGAGSRRPRRWGLGFVCAVSAASLLAQHHLFDSLKRFFASGAKPEYVDSIRRIIGIESALMMIGTVLSAFVVVWLVFSADRKLLSEIERLSDTEEELERSERNLKNVFDLLDEGIMIHDGESRIIDCNEGLLRMYGMTREQALSSSVLDLSQPGHTVSELRLLYERMAEGSVSRFEWNARKADSCDAFDVDVILKKGEWYGKSVFIAEIRDISARKKAEEALRSRTAELERFERLVVGRELRMVELKKRIGELEGQEAARNG